MFCSIIEKTFSTLTIMNFPLEMLNKIMLYNSHPTADIMRVLIIKYQEVMAMRSKNANCCYLSFYKTWCNVELDQVKIDKLRTYLQTCRYDHLEFDF
jgi:hypothetical protein